MTTTCNPSSEVEVISAERIDALIDFYTMPKRGEVRRMDEVASCLHELKRRRAEEKTAGDWKHMNVCIHGRSAEPCQKCAEIIARAHEHSL